MNHVSIRWNCVQGISGRGTSSKCTWPLFGNRHIDIRDDIDIRCFEFWEIRAYHQQAQELTCVTFLSFLLGSCSAPTTPTTHPLPSLSTLLRPSSTWLQNSPPCTRFASSTSTRRSRAPPTNKRKAGKTNGSDQSFVPPRSRRQDLSSATSIAKNECISKQQEQ